MLCVPSAEDCRVSALRQRHKWANKPEDDMPRLLSQGPKERLPLMRKADLENKAVRVRVRFSRRERG